MSEPIQIPGLLVSKKTIAEEKLTESELQAKRDSFEEAIKNFSKGANMQIAEGPSLSSIQGIHNYLDQSKYKVGTDPYQMWGDPNGSHDLYKQRIQPNVMPYFNPNQGPFGQQINKSTDWEFFDQIKKEDPFSAILNAIFDTSEKEQFLMTLGFEFFQENGEDYMSRTINDIEEKCTRVQCFERIFLREISIKFKNLLISKNTLKLKI